jgi:hypothetical protein
MSNLNSIDRLLELQLELGLFQFQRLELGQPHHSYGEFLRFNPTLARNFYRLLNNKEATL